MPTRNTISSGGYPTGRAPFSMDLSSQMDAITQQMIQNRRNQIKEEKLKITDSEDAVLNALDFKTLEGAGDKFAADHAKRLDDLNLKWAKRLKDKGGILNTNDKLELVKDKRDVEEKLQRGAAEIAQYQELQKTLRTPGQKIYNTVETAKAVNPYIKEGNLGQGSLLNHVVLQEQPFGAEWYSRMNTLGYKDTQCKDCFDEDIVGVDELGNNKISRTNKRKVDDFMEFATQDSEYRELLQQDPEQAASLANSLRLRFLKEPTTEKPAKATGGKTATQLATEKVVDERFETVGNLIQGLAERNPESANVLNSSKHGVQNVEYDVDDKGDEVMIVTFAPKTQTGSAEIQTYKLPKTEEEKKNFYEKMWDILPDEIKKGVEFKDIKKLVKPTNTTVKNQVPLKKVKQVEDALSDAEKNISKDKTKALVKTIQANFPNIKIEAKTNIWGDNSITLFDVDGNGKEYSFKDKKRIAEFKLILAERMKPQKQISTNSEEEEASKVETPAVVKPTMFQ